MLDKELPLKFMEVDEERTRLVLLSTGCGDWVCRRATAVVYRFIYGTSGLLHQSNHDRITTVENVVSTGVNDEHHAAMPLIKFVVVLVFIQSMSLRQRVAQAEAAATGRRVATPEGGISNGIPSGFNLALVLQHAYSDIYLSILTKLFSATYLFDCGELGREDSASGQPAPVQSRFERA
ncbi:hypothetical protein R1sor_023012 [Riccia sorocarpa]|uniref:Uncharacterized protein n=1 Tax=Riccia sorocarpa TaxID=122646 RepID=A0ABD3GN89_9MARC